MRLIAHMLIGEDKMMWGSDVSVVWGLGIAAVLPSRRELSSLLVYLLSGGKGRRQATDRNRGWALCLLGDKISLHSN